jgi:cystathionine beta-lyase family protein involved in aluminum resistance
VAELVPIYKVCFASSAVRALIGGVDAQGKNIIRFYGWGQAPAQVARPYVTWQNITGFPGNNISDLPDYDLQSLQIDVFASKGTDAEAVAKALRDAIEPHMHITSWDGESRDPVTTDYRFIFSVDWYTKR